MSKTLFLFRHGKSDWDADYSTDHERPVASRGRRAARLMGRFLRASAQIPDLVITSSAVRAHTTAELAREAGTWASPLEVDSRLYGADPSTVLDVVRAVSTDLASVMLVGHEPTCSASIDWLCGPQHARFPTAAMARIDFCVDSWKKIQAGNGDLTWLLRPKALQALGTDQG